MKKRRKPRAVRLDEHNSQRIAIYIISNQTLTLKQMAFNLGISYATVYRVLRERVNVNKTLSLRYPTTGDEK